MKISEALDNERNRKEKEKWNKMYLHKDGKFYHVYEWSAWLLKNFVLTEEYQKERGDDKALQAFLYKTRKSEYVIVGFPVESLSKYVPFYTNITPLEHDDLEIEISLPDCYAEAEYEAIESVYEQWRSMCESKESKKVQHQISQQEMTNRALCRSGLFAIISKVLAYPVEKSTPADNINFISEVKQEVAALL